MPQTFTVVPNIDLTERWEWKTDIIDTYNGTEQRMALRSRPRVSQDCSFGPLTLAERREFIEVLQLNIKDIYATPIWAWNTAITQETASGNGRIYFDPIRVPVADGGLLVLINPTTGLAENHYVTTTESDGATLSTNVANTIGTDWVVCLGCLAFIDNNSGFTEGQQTVEAEVKFQSTLQPAVERENTSASLNTFDSLTVLERKFLIDSSLEFDFTREITDFGFKRVLDSAHPYADIVGKKSFIMDRVLSNTDADYWRKFLNTVKGAWKPFLLSTQMNDLTLDGALTQNGTSITVNEPSIEAPDDAFSRIQIEYSDGTTSRHVLSNRTDNMDGTYTFDVSPNIPNDAKVANVSKISYLLKVRMSDTVTFNHGSLRTEVSFDIRTTDQ